MNKEEKIIVFGGSGFVGKNLTKELVRRGFDNVLSLGSSDLDLTDKKAVETFINKEKPKFVFFLAARYGGVLACKENKAEFLYENSIMALNVVKALHDLSDVRLINVSSSTVYPKDSPQPLKEDYLMNGKLEPNVEGYALAKILAMKLCDFYNNKYKDDFFSVIPTNMYGPEDRFYNKDSNVIAALITKFHEAKVNNKSEVELFGTGTPKRDFLFVKDFVNALIFLANRYKQESNKINCLNIGSGKEVSIYQLAMTIKDVVEYSGKIVFNDQYPDGAKRKLLDIDEISTFGWNPKTKLNEGIKRTYEWFLDNISNKRGA